MINISEKYENLLDQWKNSLDNPAAVMSSSDPLSNEERRKFFFLVLNREVDRMNGILRKQKRNMSKGTVNTTSLPIEYYKKLAREVDLARIYDPPGNHFISILYMLLQLMCKFCIKT